MWIGIINVNSIRNQPKQCQTSQCGVWQFKFLFFPPAASYLGDYETLNSHKFHMLFHLQESLFC